MNPGRIHLPQSINPHTAGGRVFIAASLLAFVAIAGCRRSSPEASTAGSSTVARPNVLLVTFDTTRFDRLSCYGYQAISTPAIDSLAAEGARFSRCYTVAPLTLPAHASILTGLYPFAHGLRNNGVGPLDPQVETLAELLSRHGYRTGAYVAAFVLDSRFGLQQGFETYDDEVGGKPGGRQHHYAERDAEHVTDAAISWLSGPTDRPYFLWVHYFDPHQPYAPPGLPAGTPNETAYDLEIQYADRQLARLLDRVRAVERESHRDTIIVFVTDHGESMHDHGELTHAFFIYNATVQAALIVQVPGRITPGTVVTTPVSVVDVFPSLLNWLDLEVPYEVHGRELPLSDAQVADPRRLLYFETYMPYDTYRWSPLEGLVVGGFKYIHAPKPEYYDVLSDPRERNDLIAVHPDRVTEALAALRQLRQTSLNAPAFTTADRGELNPSDAAALRGLGYVGSPTAPPDDIAGLPNPRDLIDVHNQAVLATQKIDEGDAREAVVWLTRVLQRDPVNLLALRFVAELLEDPEAASYALDLAEQAVARDLPDPFTIRLPIAFALAQARRGSVDRAISLLQPLVDRHPDSPDAHHALAVCFLGAGRIAQAESEVRSALALDPRFAPALETQGDLEVHRGDLHQAIEWYERSESALQPSAVSNLKIAEALYGLKKLDDAAIRYRKAIEANPKMMQAYLGLAAIFSDRGEWAEAIRVLRGAVGIDPNQVDAQYNLGLALFQSGDATGAIEAFAAALRADPNHGQAAINLGIARFTIGDEEGAIAALEQAATLEAAAPDAHFNLGVAWAKRGQTDRAVEHYELAARLRPGYEQAISELVGYYLGRGDAVNAARVLRAGVDHQPNHVAYNNMLAMILATSRSDEVRNGAEAVRLAEHATRLTDQQQPDVLGMLAAAYAEQGAFDRALEAVQRAIDLAASSHRARLVEQLNAQQALYRSGKPYRDPRF